MSQLPADSNIVEAIKRSGLSEPEQIDRALRLWIELFDMDRAGWKFHAHHAETGQSMPIKDWELVRDDPSKVVTAAEIAADPLAAKRNDP